MSQEIEGREKKSQVGGEENVMNEWGGAEAVGRRSGGEDGKRATDLGFANKKPARY